MTDPLTAGARVPTADAVLLPLFFGLFFYQWGAANLEGFLTYPLLRDVGEKLGRHDYLALRAAVMPRVVPLLIVPFVLSIASSG